MEPRHLFGLFDDLHQAFDQTGVLEAMRAVNGTRLIALDATWYFSSQSKNIHCPGCSCLQHAGGQTTHFHSAITPVIVSPGHSQRVSLRPEFIVPQDGQVKQDCELNAAKRWLDIPAAPALHDRDPPLHAPRPSCDSPKRRIAVLWTQPTPDRRPTHLMWFSPNDRYVVVGYHGGAIDVLDVKLRGQQVTGFTNHTKVVLSLQFLTDGKEVISASRDGSVRVWELNTGCEVGETKSAPYHGTKGIRVQAINPNNLNEVATGDYDGALFLWDRVTGKKLAPDFRQGVDEISHLSFSNDGSYLFVVEGEKRIRVLDRASGTELADIPSANEFISVTLGPDNERILTASRSGRSQIWAPVHTKSDVTDTLGRAHDDLVIQAAFSPDGSRIVTASYDKTVKVWETASQKLLLVFPGHTNELLKADFSPDGRRIVSVDSRGEFRVLDSRTGEEIFHQAFSSDRFFKSAESRNGLRGIFLDHVAGLSSNPFSPSANEPKVVVNSDQGLLVRRGVDGRDSFLLKEGQNVAWPVINPSGDLVAAMTATLDVINVWDLNTGELNYTLKGHKSVAFWAEFSRDGKRIVTGSANKTAIVWDASDGAKLFPLIGHKNFVSVAHFSPDGERIATSGFDIEALIWNARTGSSCPL